MEGTNVFIDFQLNIEEGTSIFNGDATCLVYSENLEQTINVGYASFYLFNTHQSSYQDICGDADNISKDLYIAVSSLEKICEVEKIQGQVVVFDVLSIEEGWRGKGIGNAFVEKMTQQFATLGVNLFLLIPNFDIIKMGTYYEDKGFLHYKIDEATSVMYGFVEDIMLISNLSK